MAVSLKNDANVRRMLRRKNGATGAELQEARGRAFPYSLWSLRVLADDTHDIYQLRDGREMRYWLLTRAEYAERFGKASNGNHKPNGNGKGNGKAKIAAEAAPSQPDPTPAAEPAAAAVTAKPRGRKPGRSRAA
jgi:hypothetical protein